MAANRAVQRVTTAVARRPAVGTTQRSAVAVAPSPARALQQRLGNHGAQRFGAQVVARSSAPGGSVGGGTSAGTFSLSAPDDASEREADRVADAVMRTTERGSASPSPSALTVQRACADCEEEMSKRARAAQPVAAGDAPEVHRSASSAEASQVSAPVAASIHDMQGGGAPLADATRALFEPRFGADFSHVRVHTGAQARETAKSIDAKAFTVGRDIAFAGGQYSPDSHEGQKLLAHELTHVVQQRGGAGAAVAANGISNAGGTAVRQADAGATQVAAHGTSARLPASLVSVSAPASRATVYRDPQRDVARAEPPPAAIDSDLEDRIRAELNQVIAPTKGKALRAREQRLTIIFNSVVGLDRTTLLERLSKSQHNDTLAHLFHGRLHTATRNRLISRLRGEPVPLPAVTDAMTLPAFRQQLSDDSIILSPAQPLIDDTFQPRAIVGWFPRAELGPPMDEPPVAVQWEVYDPAHEVVFGVTSPWDTADPVGHSNRFETDKPGPYHISGRIIQGGLLVAELHRFFDVTKTSKGSEGALAGALGIEADQRQQQFDQRRAQLAGELSDDDRKRIGQELAKLEFAGSQVGQQLQQPVAPPPDAHNFRGLILSTDPAHCRSLIEDVYAREGENGIPAFLNKVYQSYNLATHDIDPRTESGMTARQKVYRAGEACRDALMRQWELLQKDIAAFLRQFQETAEVTTRQMLQLSDAKCDAEIEKYGLEQHVRHHEIDTSFSDELGRHGGIQKYTTVDYSGGTNDKAQEMQRAAADLAAAQRELDKLRKRRAEVISKLDLHALHERRVTNTLTLEESLLRQNDLIDDIVYGPPAEPRAQLEALLQSLDRLVTQAEEVHGELIVEKTERFAVLAGYKKVDGEKTNVDPGGLEKLAVGPVAGQIGPRIFEAKKNIATTLRKLGDKDLSIWKEPRLVQLTMPQMLVVPGSWRERAVEEEAADASRPSWKDWALMAVTFALVALTFIPTGGGSALVGGIVIAAELGGLALDIYLISEQIEEYQLDKAKAGTDLDKAHAVSASEPTLFWLAVDIIATAVGLGLAAKTFKEINHARKMAMTAVDATKVDEALAFIHAQAREGKISAKAASRLEDEARAAGKAAHLEEAGDAAAAVGRTPLSDADLPSMEARLGVPVERDPGLTQGVRVEFDFDGDKLRVTRVLVGTASTIEDVLAHRRTISRITRYNGAIGKLRRVWDEIVVLLGGRVDINPFPTGSRAWASFEELRKLDDLIELRRTKLQSATGLDAKLLDDEIAFLEGEVWHHSEVVKTARETGEVGAGQAKWIERPDVGEVTKEALKKRYPLPAKHPEHYYYRHKVNPAKGEPEFELAIKSSAPDSLNLETYRTVMKNGKPALEIGPAPGRTMAVFPKHWDDARVLDAMTGPDSRSAFKQYAEMLGRQGLATPADIKAAVKRIRKAAGDMIDEDDLRRALKQTFEPDVLKHMTDPRLSAKTSYERMREVTDKLNSSDKGNLVEDWYHTRFTPSAERHVAVSKGDLASAKPPVKIDENRFIDIAEKGTGREVKSGGNALSEHDLEQFKDFLKVVKGGGEVGGQKLMKLHYVFTNPDAVASNLEWMKKAFAQAEGKLSIEVFNKSGESRKISKASELSGLAAWAGK